MLIYVGYDNNCLDIIFDGRPLSSDFTRILQEVQGFISPVGVSCVFIDDILPVLD